jgi:hypothetical protein
LDSYLGDGFYKNEQKSWLTPNKCLSLYYVCIR